MRPILIIVVVLCIFILIFRVAIYLLPFIIGFLILDYIFKKVFIRKNIKNKSTDDISDESDIIEVDYEEVE